MQSGGPTLKAPRPATDEKGAPNKQRGRVGVGPTLWRPPAAAAAGREEAEAGPFAAGQLEQRLLVGALAEDFGIIEGPVGWVPEGSLVGCF